MISSLAFRVRRLPKLLLLALLSARLVLADPSPAPAAPAAPSPQVETIVCIRHGEKPRPGLGNLDVQGLNRALALPDVLGRYGTPAYIFAPDPAEDKVNESANVTDGTSRAPVCYVRPLLTIGPTAIRYGLPINTAYGFKHIDELEKELDRPVYRSSVIFVAWEHIEAEKFMRNEVRDHAGNPDTVPVWPGNDFDSIYVAQIIRKGDAPAIVVFHVDHEGLNGLSTAFPHPAAVVPQ